MNPAAATSESKVCNLLEFAKRGVNQTEVSLSPDHAPVELFT
jgi:hypothetical protein